MFATESIHEDSHDQNLLNAQFMCNAIS